MERRKFIKTAGVGAVAGATAAASSFPKPALSQSRRELTMVMTWPKNFPGLGTGAERFADRITAATDGRLTVRVFGAGEIVPAFESFDAVQSGSADMYHGAEYYWTGKSKAFNFFTAVPFGFTANELEAWVHAGGGQELWDELAADFGMKGLLCGNTGLQMGGWFKGEINSISDMQGIKMRMPGLGGEVLRQIGAIAVSLPGGEILPALQTGAIDATEWVGPWNDLAFGFFRVVKNYYYPGFHEPGSGLSVGINKGVWDSFSPSDQEIVKACAQAENDAMLADFNANNGRSLRKLIEEHEVVVRRFSDDVFNQFGEASEQVISDTAAEGGIVQRVAESYRDFRKDVAAWTQLSEQSYTIMRNRFLGIDT